MDNSLPDVDFSKIRILQKSQNKGFEEMSVQLFRSTFPEGTEFYRADDTGGDGGVEDIVITPDKKKFAMQAKYFTSLSTSQWAQIDKSVRTAIKTHAPDLVEYRIYTPQNRSKNTKSWDNYKEKWNNSAKSEFHFLHDIEFKWIGDTELRSELIKEQNHGILQYWFNFPAFSHEWLLKEFKKSKASIDTRYTPDRHIQTNVENQLSAFCLTEAFKRGVCNRFKELKHDITGLLEKLDKLPQDQRSNIEDKRNMIASLFDSVKVVPDFDALQNVYNEIRKVLNTVLMTYYKFQEEHSEDHQNPYSRDPYAYDLLLINRLIDRNDSVLAFIESLKVYDKQFVLLYGNAGTGKSHAMTKITESCLNMRQSAILFVGEQFSTNEPPQQQMTNLVEWEDTFISFLQVLEQNAIIKKEPSLILIDALNECNNTDLWKNHLLGLIEEIKAFPNVRLLISCRSDFFQFVLPESLSEQKNSDFGYIEHEGFTFHYTEAIEEYFRGYKVRSDHFPPLVEEFRNPLFLKLFCEAYAEKKVPSGQYGIESIMKARIDQCIKEVTKRIGCLEYVVKGAIDYIAQEIQEKFSEGIPKEEVQRTLDKIRPSDGVEKSLYVALKSNGFITEILRMGKLLVRFPYQRSSDYLIAERLIMTLEKNSLTQIFEANRFFKEYVNNPMKHRNLLKMLAILIPEQFQIELICLFKKTNPLQLFYYDDFWESLVWRSKKSMTAVTDFFVKKYHREQPKTVLAGLFRMATIPEHPYNARWLHSWLKTLSLSQLELSWTIPISEITNRHEQNSIESFLNWIFNISPNQVDDEQVWLVSLTLAWLLSSNYRWLRYRASLALIKFLSGKTAIVVKLLDTFHDCVDPYIQERIYATACGVILRESQKENIIPITSAIYKYVYSGKFVPPNILIRDYAHTIMEYGIYKKAIAPIVDRGKIQAPHHSNWTGFSHKDEIDILNAQDGWGSIRLSLRSEKLGLYGDFGRYVMDAAVHYFSSQKLNEDYIPGTRFKKNIDGVYAGNFILNRIKALGWKPTVFLEYEKTLYGGRMDHEQEERKVERISKKYQWIGLFELLGYLADNYWLHPEDYDDEPPRICHNAVPFYLRKFDPTQPLADPKVNDSLLDDNESENSDISEVSLSPLKDNFSNVSLLMDREAWVSAPPSDFSKLIETNEANKTNWLLLAGHFYSKEPLQMDQNESTAGKCEIWVDIRCWLIKKNDMASSLKYSKNKRFYGVGWEHTTLRNTWLGEYPWAKNCQQVKDDCITSPSWIEKCHGDAVKTSCKYQHGQHLNALLPSPQLMDIVSIKWSGVDFNYCDSNDNLICRNIKREGQMPILQIKKDEFLQKINHEGYVPVWTTLAEKSCRNGAELIVAKFVCTQRIYEEHKNMLKMVEEMIYDCP